jgi:L-lactate dehydrogenase (cytochrome)
MAADSLTVPRDRPWSFQSCSEADRMVLMIDGGIRRGTDVLKCLALGAQFAFVGRPFLFAAVGGTEGVRHAIRVLAREIDRDMAMLGVRDWAEIGPWVLGGAEAS